MDTKIFEATGLIVDLARQAQDIRISNAKECGYHQQMNTIEFWEYFATLKMDFGRQSGKSRYIATHAKSGDVILVDRSCLVDNMRRTLACHQIDDVHVTTVVGFASGRGKQKTIPQGATIWIDDASYAFRYALGGITFRDVLCEAAVRSNAYAPGVGADIRFVCLG